MIDNRYELHWEFRNNHKWHRGFYYLEDLLAFLYNCGLGTHPDIINVYFKDYHDDSIQWIKKDKFQ